MERWLWVQRQDIGPGARKGHAMAYHAARKRVLLFGGGNTQGLLNDTWEWDGSNWTQVADMGPSPRIAAEMVDDPVRGRVVLFGGESASLGVRLNDTWEWDGAQWIQVADMGPSTRESHAMAFHAALQRVILFGGTQSLTINSELGDTWEWDGAEWVQIADTGPRRIWAALAYAADHERLILFGGWAGPGWQADTWQFVDGNWTKLQDMGPGDIVSPRMVQAGSRTVLFGSPAGSVPGRTWEWDGKLWVQRQNMGPAARNMVGLAYDGERHFAVLFGGELPGSSTRMADTWELMISAQQ
jgi:hypothetical protein